jgi:putative transcriptional regulator
MARAVLSHVQQSEMPSKGGAMSLNKQSASPVHELRRRLNMTQEEFAHAIGVTVSTVNRWENGHIEPSRLARRAIEGLTAQLTDEPNLEAALVAMNAKES